MHAGRRRRKAERKHEESQFIRCGMEDHELIVGGGAPDDDADH